MRVLRLFAVLAFVGVVFPAITFAENCKENAAKARICVGSTVIDQHDYIGEVQALYKNRKAKVQWDFGGTPFLVHIDTLSPEVTSLGELQAGDQVIDEDGYTGVIVRLFEDGRVKMKSSKFSELLTEIASKLSKQTDNLDGFTVGDRIIYLSGWIGTITKIFKNGVAFIDYDNGNRNDSIKLINLSKSVECDSKSGICVGDSVIDQDNYEGEVRMIFENRKVQVEYEHETLVVDIETLSKKEE